MKRLLFLLLLVGCNQSDIPLDKTNVIHVENQPKTQYDIEGYIDLASVIEIDGCEYFIIKQSHGSYNLEHKGNCKQCRGKAEKEQ